LDGGSGMDGLTGKEVRRFFSKLRLPELGTGECWGWDGLGNSRGYSTMTVQRGDQRKKVLAHRIAYRLWYGPIPAKLGVCHRCDNPPCCNPSHLFVGTQADNMRDAVAKGRVPSALKGSCKRGHPLHGTNLILQKGANGRWHRVCRTCRHINEEARWRRRLSL